MRAKNLGRHELLGWINSITQSDYSKIENLSDGVAFCQLYDAFYPNLVNLNQLKSKFLIF
jgi:RP/EB family microtubule-associated protein